MHPDKILFVLGAGSNATLNFPTGAGLKEAILSRLNGTEETYKKVFGGRIYSEETADLFANRFRVSDVGTIDEFVREQKNQEEIVTFARHVVAYEIGSAEASATLFHNPRSEWYHTLRKALREHPECVEACTVGFVTFNYDRSLEHYLEQTLRNWGYDAAKIRRFIGPSNLVHVHGQLGLLPILSGVDGSGIAFGSVPKNFQSISYAARNLFFPTDGLPPSMQTSLDTLVRNAKYVVFLGFGFDPTNVRRLNLGDASSLKFIYCTVSQSLSAARQNSIGQLLPGRIKRHDKIVPCMAGLAEEMPIFRFSD